MPKYVNVKLPEDQTISRARVRRRILLMAKRANWSDGATAMKNVLTMILYKAVVRIRSSQAGKR